MWSRDVLTAEPASAVSAVVKAPGWNLEGRAAPVSWARRES